MTLNLKLFSADYKLHTTNYKEKGAPHDDIILHATVPYFVYKKYPGFTTILALSLTMQNKKAA